MSVGIRSFVRAACAARMSGFSVFYGRFAEMLTLLKVYNAVKRPFERFHSEEDAPTMVEYGLLVALIAVVVAVAALVLGTQISTIFSNVAVTVGN